MLILNGFLIIKHKMKYFNFRLKLLKFWIKKPGYFNKYRNQNWPANLNEIVEFCNRKKNIYSLVCQNLQQLYLMFFFSFFWNWHENRRQTVYSLWLTDNSLIDNSWLHEGFAVLFLKDMKLVCLTSYTMFWKPEFSKVVVNHRANTLGSNLAQFKPVHRWFKNSK